MKKSIIFAWLVLGLLFAGCGGPDLDEPDAAAKSYVIKELEQDRNRSSDELDRMRWRIECAEIELDWYADKADAEKRLKKDKALYEFIEDNLSDLEKHEVSIVRGAQDEKEGDKVIGKSVELRIAGKTFKDKAGEENKFELSDKDQKRTILLTQIEKKWKVKN